MSLDLNECRALVTDDNTLESVAKKVMESIGEDGGVEPDKLKELLDNFCEDNDISAPSTDEIDDYKKSEGMKADEKLDLPSLKLQLNIYFGCAKSLGKI